MAKVEFILDRDIFDESIREIAKRGVVLDIGAGTPFCKELSKYKDVFKRARYYSLDIKFHPELSVVGDAQSLPFKNESVDGMICKGTLCGVFEPQRVVREIYRVLKERGLLYVYVPFLYPFHEGQTDYWRLTKDGILRLFWDFEEIKLQPNEGYIGTTLRFMTAFSKEGSLLKILRTLENFFENIFNIFRKRKINRLHNTTRFNVLIRK